MAFPATLERPSKGLRKCRIEVVHLSSEAENNNGIGHEIEEGPVLLLRHAARFADALSGRARTRAPCFSCRSMSFNIAGLPATRKLRPFLHRSSGSSSFSSSLSASILVFSWVPSSSGVRCILAEGGLLCHHNYLVSIPIPVIFSTLINVEPSARLGRALPGKMPFGEINEERLFFRFFCFAVSFFFSPFASAQPASGPRMVLKEKHHDFKEVNEGAVVEHSFKVRNQGDQVLEIQRVNPG
jgi:hypothetical protein